MKPEDVLTHYDDTGSTNVKWLREMIAQEAEGEIPEDNRERGDERTE